MGQTALLASAILDSTAVGRDLLTSAAMADPNADRMAMWDDSAGGWAWLTVGTGLSISGTTIVPIGPYVSVQAYNDGIRTDIEQLEAAYAACPAGGTIVLEAGKTYTLTRRFNIAKAMRVDLNGATLTRANQLTTTLTANAGSGATSLTVASSAGFTVGERVGVVSGTGIANVKSLSVLIVAIPDGTTLTVGQTTGAAVSTDTVFREVVLVQSTAICEIYGGTIDGNKTGNPITQAWNLNPALNASARVFVHDLVIQNSPGESLIAPAGSTILRIRATDLQGSIVHVSNAVAGPYYRGVWLSDIYADTVCTSTTNGHNESWLTFSVNCCDVLAENVRVKTCGTAALPSMDVDDNRAVFRNVIVEDAAIDTAFSAAQSDVAFGYVTIESCEFIRCKDFLFAGKNLTKGFCVRDVTIQNVKFTDCRVDFIHALNIVIRNVEMRYSAAYAESAAAKNRPGALVFEFFDRIKIDGLLIEGPNTVINGLLIGLALYTLFDVVRKNSAGTSLNHLYPTDVSVSNVVIANFPSGIASLDTSNSIILKSVVGWKWDNIRVFSHKEGNTQSGQGICIPAGCYCTNLFVATQFTTLNHSYYPIVAYGIDSTGSITKCRGAIVENATILQVVAQGARKFAIGGSTAGRSNYNVVTRNIKTSHTTLTYDSSADAARSSLEAITNIGVTTLTSLTAEDPHLLYGVLENAGQY